MKYAFAFAVLAISVAIVAGPLVGLWWAYRDKNAPVKHVAWELAGLVLIVIIIGSLLWTAIDYSVIKGMR